MKNWILLCFSLLVFSSPAHSVPQKTDVLIIGAGLSGLASAYYLKKHGIPYQILEITPRIGGRVRTVRYDRPGENQIYSDSGMEEYWESNPAVELLKELKLRTRSDVAVSSISLSGKVEKLRDETAAEYHARIFTKEERDALLAFKTKITPWVEKLHKHDRLTPLPPDLTIYQTLSFKDFVLSQNLPQKTAEWVRVSIECEVGTGWDRISAADGLAEFHIFIGEGELSFRVLGGNDRFSDAIANKVGRHNISLNHRVTRVTSAKSDVEVRYLNTVTNTSGSIRAKHVVSTIPLFRLFEVQFEPPLSEKKRAAIQSMAWGSYFKAHVFVKNSARRFWVTEDVSYLPILSDSELGVIYEGNPDQKDSTKIISMLVHGDHAERYNMMPLAQVRSEIFAGLEKLWPGFLKEVLDVEFYRYHPRAIGSWPVGRSRFDEGSRAIRIPENRVYLAGDFTESSHSDGAFRSAQRAVKQIVSAR